MFKSILLLSLLAAASVSHAEAYVFFEIATPSQHASSDADDDSPAHEWVYLAPDRAGVAYADLGEVLLGQTEERTFAILNSGDTPVEHLAPRALAAPFAYKGGSYPGVGGSCAERIEAHAGCTIVVTYQPTEAGEMNGLLWVTYADESHVHARHLILTGHGQEPMSEGDSSVVPGEEPIATLPALESTGTSSQPTLESTGTSAQPALESTGTSAQPTLESTGTSAQPTLESTGTSADRLPPPAAEATPPAAEAAPPAAEAAPPAAEATPPAAEATPPAAEATPPAAEATPPAAEAAPPAAEATPPAAEATPPVEQPASDAPVASAPESTSGDHAAPAEPPATPVAKEDLHRMGRDIAHDLDVATVDDSILGQISQLFAKIKGLLESPTVSAQP